MIFRPGVILSADWAKEGKKRSVWAADVRARTICQCIMPGGWTLCSLLEEADRQVSRGPVLVAVDAALGVPSAYFSRRGEVVGWERASNFVEWLPLAAELPGFFKETRDPAGWSLVHPFFAVPKGRGSLGAFRQAARFDLLRGIERSSRANSLFIVSGIPGSVGCGTRELWRELSKMLESERPFRVWPFEGDLESSLREKGIVLAEMYPRVTYAIAMSPDLPAAPMKKTDRDVRSVWTAALKRAEWIRRSGVRLADLSAAIASEDDFDALFAVAALFRCVLEDLPLTTDAAVDDVAEGGILAAGITRLRMDGRYPRAGSASGQSAARRGPDRTQDRRDGERVAIRCPITGCGWVFKMHRAGWDAHVGSPRRHPEWLPRVTDPEARKARFRSEFLSWFDAPDNR